MFLRFYFVVVALSVMMTTCLVVIVFLVMVCNACGRLNFTAADCVFYLDLMFDPSGDTEEQVH